MTNKHTPGPWKTDGRNVLQADFVNEKHIAWVSYNPTGHAAHQKWETRASARLIAAAPELLAALEQSLFMIEQYEGTSDENDKIVDAARAAIAKAKGAKP